FFNSGASGQFRSEGVPQTLVNARAGAHAAAGPPQDKSGPPQDYRTGPPQDQKTGPPQDYRTGPVQDRQTGPPQDQRTGPPQDQRTGPPQDWQTRSYRLPGGRPEEHPTGAGPPRDSHLSGPPRDHAGPPRDHSSPPQDSRQSVSPARASVVSTAGDTVQVCKDGRGVGGGDVTVLIFTLDEEFARVSVDERAFETARNQKMLNPASPLQVISRDLAWATRAEERRFRYTGMQSGSVIACVEVREDPSGRDMRTPRALADDLLIQVREDPGGRDMRTPRALADDMLVQAGNRDSALRTSPSMANFIHVKLFDRLPP
ncbi:hypothetical protein T484DRAFT_1825194, partial [Baffinella frigidus]